jgi:branched-chain amino acid transport system ATP-binding protein
MALLDIEALAVRIGGLDVLSGIDLSVAAGEAVGLFGPNGSGKTTLFNAITGITAAAAGRIRLAGRDITGDRPDRIAEAGIARTFQTPRVFQRMTVADNIRPARRAFPGHALNRLLGAAGLAGRRDELAADLTLCEVKRLEIARALALAPRLLLLDEPTGGLTPAEAADIVGLVRDLVPKATALIVIEHRLDVLRSLCPRAVALDHGTRIADGALAAVEQDGKVRAAYFGSAATATE